MKTQLRHLTIMALLLLVLTACAMAPVAAAANPNTASSVETTTLTNAQPVDETLSAPPLTPLSEAEAASLIYMREEEKLARDVYLAFYAQWQLPLFQNIANSESTHMASIKTLLDRYGLVDPVGSNGTGVFTNATLQDLYNQLIAEGSQSAEAALQVGALIEEVDIADLQQGLTAITHADIIRVYSSLIRGSENHLRAFTSQLTQLTGATYVPQYLDQVTYDTLLSTPMGQNGARGQGMNGMNGMSGMNGTQTCEETQDCQGMPGGQGGQGGQGQRGGQGGQGRRGNN